MQRQSSARSTAASRSTRRAAAWARVAVEEAVPLHRRSLAPPVRSAQHARAVAGAGAALHETVVAAGAPLGEVAAQW